MQVCFSIPSFSRPASGTGMHRVVTSDLSNRKHNALVECNGDLVAPMDRVCFASPQWNGWWVDYRRFCSQGWWKERATLTVEGAESAGGRWSWYLKAVWCAGGLSQCHVLKPCSSIFAEHLGSNGLISNYISDFKGSTRLHRRAGTCRTELCQRPRKRRLGVCG